MPTVTKFSTDSLFTRGQFDNSTIEDVLQFVAIITGGDDKQSLLARGLLRTNVQWAFLTLFDRDALADQLRKEHRLGPNQPIERALRIKQVIDAMLVYEDALLDARRYLFVRDELADYVPLLPVWVVKALQVRLIGSSDPRRVRRQLKAAFGVLETLEEELAIDAKLKAAAKKPRKRGSASRRGQGRKPSDDSSKDESKAKGKKKAKA